jgi:hypothetical protein
MADGSGLPPGQSPERAASIRCADPALPVVATARVTCSQHDRLGATARTQWQAGTLCPVGERLIPYELPGPARGAAVTKSARSRHECVATPPLP